MTTPRRLVLIAALALVPIAPYALLGYTGQDLPFHVSSWLRLKDSWLAAHYSSGWSPAANYGRGDPHLTLYPPLSLFFGALLTLILPLKVVPGTYAWLALALSGVTMYAASKTFVAERDRLTAAILYMLGPYTLTTSLVRFAAAELLVQSWLPLIVLYFYQAVWMPNDSASGQRQTSRHLLQLALLLGLSWITNIPASIVLFYSLGVTAVLCALVKRSGGPLFRMVLAEGLAITLAAFYLLPVWQEHLWVHSNTLLRLDSLQMLLFMPHNTFSDAPLLIAGWIFLCVQMLLAIACLRKRSLALFADPTVLIWACFALASFLFQTPFSMPLWQHAPELRFVQFPFRFLSMLGVALPLLLLSRGTRVALRRPAFIVLALLSITPFLGYISEQAVAANRTPPLPQLLASWQRKGAPEYLPIAASLPDGPPPSPAVSGVDLANPALTDADCHVKLQQQSPDLRVLHTVSQAACRARLTVYYYPYWCALDESGHSVHTSPDQTGLLLVDVQPGTHTVSVAFHPASTVRTASATCSLITLLLLTTLLLLHPRPAPLQTPMPV